MTGRRLIASGAAAVAAFVTLSAAASWESKPYHTWTDSDLKEVLNNSAWASKGSVTFSQPRGGNYNAIEEVALVSWVSALPLRQASFREQLGQLPTAPREADAVLAQPTNIYVVALKISGTGSSSGYAANAKTMMGETFLMRDGKAPIAPVAAEGHMLDKDNKVIETPAPRGRGPGAAPAAPGAPAGPAGPTPDAPAGAPVSQSAQMATVPAAAPSFQRGGGGGGGGRGAGGGGIGGGQGMGGSRGVASILVYVFPKTELITIADKEVEFVTKLCGGGGFGGGGRGASASGSGANCQYNVKKKFKLKDMMYKGELAL